MQEDFNNGFCENVTYPSRVFICMCVRVCVCERERERWHLPFKKNVSPSTQNHILTSDSTGGSGDWHHIYEEEHAYVTQTHDVQVLALVSTHIFFSRLLRTYP